MTTAILPGRISVDAARELVGTAAFLDVREDHEIESGMIPCAKWIRLGELEDRLSEVPRSDSGRLVIVCAAGRRSLHATLVLRQAGRMDAQSMDGGMTAWMGRGFPVEPPTKDDRA